MAFFIRDCWSAFGERLWREPALANDLFRAMCNNVWLHTDGTRFAVTWRAAAEIVAGLRMDSELDYLDFYFCVGQKGVVTRDIHDALARCGWRQDLEQVEGPSPDATVDG